MTTLSNQALAELRSAATRMFMGSAMASTSVKPMTGAEMARNFERVKTWLSEERETRRQARAELPGVAE